MSDPTPTLPALAPSSTVDYYQPMPVFLAKPRRPRYWVHILLLVATIFTTLVVGSHMQASFNAGHSAFAFDDDDVLFPLFPLETVWRHPQQLLLGVPFSASLMLILLAHEMGHYLYCVHYGVSATLPYFIPFPSLVGTMGAFIRIRSPIRSRAALFDIGIAGPIAGFVVACSVLFFALGLSRPIPAAAFAAPGGPFPGIEMRLPLIFSVIQKLLAGLGLLRGVAILPFHRLYLHPVAIAAWFGMFATSLNLLPGGQLDGGHIVYSIAPRAHRFISRLTILVLIPMAVYLWAGWLIWAVLLELSSLRHPQVAERPKVTGGRLWLAAFAVVMLVLTLVPAPFSNGSLKQIVREVRGK
jgi:membrane-associated protease RseP (regulator of RpoE activity)